METSPENKELRLDNRHLLLFFLAAVLICASFFALGFWMGHGQAGEAARAVGEGSPSSLATSGTVSSTTGAEGTRASSPGGTEGSRTAIQDPAGPADLRKELDFYSAVKDQSVAENFSPRPTAKEKQTEAKQPSRAPGASSGSAADAGGMLHLQVAALRKRADANRLADELRGKGYPVVVVTPSKSESPHWIRVKVGPYRSTRETSQVKARLARDGYDSILRRQ